MLLDRHYIQLITLNQEASLREIFKMPPALEAPLVIGKSNPWETLDFIPARSLPQKGIKHSIASLLAPTDAISDPLTSEKSKDAPYKRRRASPDHFDYFIRYNPSPPNDWITLV